MAKVTKQFDGVPDGEIYPKTFMPGDEVTGDLAAVAIKEKWAEEGDAVAKPETKAPAKAPETK